MTGDEILIEIKRRIIELDYQPGVLLNEEMISKEFNVSRTPIRETFLKLARLDLVRSIPRSGTYVAPIDIKTIKYAYEMKQSLEGLAAKLAALRATEAEIEELDAIVERMKKYDIRKNYGECISDDQFFHKKTREASKNPLLIEALDTVNLKIERFLRHIQYVIKNIEWYNKSLELILKAIKNRNPAEAGLEAERHTDFFLRELSQTFLQDI